MIINQTKTVDTIVEWLKKYISTTNKDSWIISIPPSLTYSPYSKYVLYKTLILLTSKTSYLTYCLDKIGHEKEDTSLYNNKLKLVKQGSDIVGLAETYNGLIINPISRNEQNLIRTYHKYHDACDLKPFADLYFSEILQLYDFLQDFKSTNNNANTTNIPGSRFTWDNIEWIDRDDQRSGIITKTEDPTKHSSYFTYTLPQKNIICGVHERYKSTQHKIDNHTPICKLRNIPGLVE